MVRNVYKNGKGYQLRAYLRSIVAAFFLLTLVYPSRAQWAHTNGPYGGNIRALVISGSTLYASAYRGGVFRSTDNGATWASVGLSEQINIPTLAVSGSDLYAGVSGGVYRYSGTGPWVFLGNNGLPYEPYVSMIRAIGSALFAGAYPGLYRSTDNGAHWTHADAGLTGYGLSVNDVVAADGFLFACTNDNLYRSSDGGTTWSALGSALQSKEVKTIVPFGTDLFAAVAYDGVYRSTNMGASWTRVFKDSLVEYTDVRALTVSDMNIIVGTSNGMFSSENGGITWARVKAGLTTAYITVFAHNGTSLFCGTGGAGVFRATSTGTTWSQSSTGLVSSSVTAIGINGSTTFAGTDMGGLYRSSDKGTTWIYCGIPDVRIGAFVVSGTTIFAGTSNGIYRSTDNGVSWNAGDSAQMVLSVTSFAISDSLLFAGTNTGMYVSRDQGTSWVQSNSGLSNLYIQTVAVLNHVVFASSENLYVSYNNGVTWNSIMSYTPISALAVSGNDLLVGNAGYDVYRVRESGQTWTVESPGSGVGRIRSLAVVGSNLFAGTDELGVYRTVTTGTSWNWEWLGLRGYVGALAPSGTDLYTGTDGTGVWRIPLSSFPTGVESSPAVPSAFRLDQNYPNPFNPSTTISFSLPSRSYATLIVFDVMGRDVATIVAEEMTPGNYSRQWNASGLPSGVYFYRLQAGAFMQTRRLLLLR